MKQPISLIATTFLFFAAISCPIISTEKTMVQAQAEKLYSVDDYVERGISYAEQGNYELARTDLKKAKQISLVQGDTANAERADSALKQLP